jgi:SMODS-associated and fused to various effectors sensor domain
MTPLPARAATLLGDDYQHIIGLYQALKVVDDPELDTVHIEDAAGGAFDDVVVRPTGAAASAGRPMRCIQVKAGVYNNVVIDNKWLTAKKTAKGKSPLQHFHATWCALVAAGEPFEMEMYTNKNYDHDDLLLRLLNSESRKIPREKLDGLAPAGRAAGQLAEWAEHLKISAEEAKSFLTAVTFRHGEEEGSWAERCSHLMRLAGLRGDAEAVDAAHKVVRNWVRTGVGPRNANQILDDLAAHGLLARGGELLLTISGIDTVNTPYRPNASVDFVDLYADTDPFSRRQLDDPSDWVANVARQLETAKSDLLRFDVRRVRLVAAMRLPMYFAVGRVFSRVGNWVLVTEQRGQDWATDVDPQAAEVDAQFHDLPGEIADLAVTISLSLDPAPDVIEHVGAAGLPISRLLRLSTPDGPAQDSVSGPPWAASWVRSAREQIRTAAREMHAQHVHLFISAPAGLAMFLGHDWNLMPTTTVYEHLGFDGYTPTITLRG